MSERDVAGERPVREGQYVRVFERVCESGVRAHTIGIWLASNLCDSRRLVARLFWCKSASFDPIYTYAGSTCRSGRALSNELTTMKSISGQSLYMGKKVGKNGLTPHFWTQFRHRRRPFSENLSMVSLVYFFQAFQRYQERPDRHTPANFTIF